MKQTAVELKENILQIFATEEEELSIINKAKEMEKQQQGYNKKQVEDIMAETWIQCVGNDGDNFKEVRDKILEQFKTNKI